MVSGCEFGMDDCSTEKEMAVGDQGCQWQSKVTQRTGTFDQRHVQPSGAPPRREKHDQEEEMDCNGLCVKISSLSGISSCMGHAGL